MAEWTLKWIDNGDWDWDDVENRFVDTSPNEQGSQNSTPLANVNGDSNSLSNPEDEISIIPSGVYM
ncbi:hypothetical protein BGX26_005917, partial [Mortierella sp. AD094]